VYEEIGEKLCPREDNSNCGICRATAFLDVSYYIISELIPVMIILVMLALTK